MVPSAAIKPLTPAFDYGEAFQRNIGVVSAEDQERLREKRVAIPGCGGVGSLHALLLARAGVGKFHVADFDTFELPNFNRQFGAKLSTLGERKADNTRREILDINPTADVRTFGDGVTKANIGDFLKGVDLVVDSLDFFAFEARELLFREARRLGVPVLSAAPLGFSCALLFFSADGLSFESYFDFSPEDTPSRRAFKFAVGLAPRPTHLRYLDPAAVDFKNQRGPSHVVGVSLCAAMATASALKQMLGLGRLKAVPHYYQFDAYTQTFRRGWIPWGNRNPWQRLKLWLLSRFLLKVPE